MTKKKNVSKKSASRPIQAIFFDLDGTLVDTEPLGQKILQEIFMELGKPLLPDQARYLVGRTWRQGLEGLFGKEQFASLKDRMIEVDARIRDRYRVHLKNNLPVVNGSAEAVRQFASVHPLALVSGSRRSEIQYILEEMQILDCFQFFLGEEDYPESKPSPSGYLMAMKKMNVEPSQVLTFEDSQPGILAARRSGAWVVAITSTNHYGADQSMAHEKIQDFRGVDLDWMRTLKFLSP